MYIKVGSLLMSRCSGGKGSCSVTFHLISNRKLFVLNIGGTERRSSFNVDDFLPFDYLGGEETIMRRKQMPNQYIEAVTNLKNYLQELCNDNTKTIQHSTVLIKIINLQKNISIALGYTNIIDHETHNQIVALNTKIKNCNTAQEILNLKQETDNALVEKIKSTELAMLKDLITACYDSVIILTNEGEENMYNILVECYKYLVFIGDGTKERLNDLICDQKYVESIPGARRINLQSVISLSYNEDDHKYTLTVETIIDAIVAFKTYNQLVDGETSKLCE